MILKAHSQTKKKAGRTGRRETTMKESTVYNYREAVRYDVLEAIREGYLQEITSADYDRDDLEQKLNDQLFTDDRVTGNGSGSYTFSTWKAEEYLCHNFELLSEALQDFGCGPEYIGQKGPEACDVTIRCYLLPWAISEALDEIENEVDELGLREKEEEA